MNCAKLLHYNKYMEIGIILDPKNIDIIYCPGKICFWGRSNSRYIAWKPDSLPAYMISFELVRESGHPTVQEPFRLEQSDTANQNVLGQRGLHLGVCLMR